MAPVRLPIYPNGGGAEPVVEPRIGSYFVIINTSSAWSTLFKGMMNYDAHPVSLVLATG